MAESRLFYKKKSSAHTRVCSAKVTVPSYPSMLIKMFSKHQCPSTHPEAASDPDLTCHQPNFRLETADKLWGVTLGETEHDLRAVTVKYIQTEIWYKYLSREKK